MYEGSANADDHPLAEKPRTIPQPTKVLSDAAGWRNYKPTKNATASCGKWGPSLVDGVTGVSSWTNKLCGNWECKKCSSTRAEGVLNHFRTLWSEGAGPIWFAAMPFGTTADRKRLRDQIAQNRRRSTANYFKVTREPESPSDFDPWVLGKIIEGTTWLFSDRRILRAMRELSAADAFQQAHEALRCPGVVSIATSKGPWFYRQTKPREPSSFACIGLMSQDRHEEVLARTWDRLAPGIPKREGKPPGFTVAQWKDEIRNTHKDLPLKPRS